MPSLDDEQNKWGVAGSGKSKSVIVFVCPRQSPKNWPVPGLYNFIVLIDNDTAITALSEL